MDDSSLDLMEFEWTDYKGETPSTRHSSSLWQALLRQTGWMSF
jgi:hypothetical protein